MDLTKVYLTALPSLERVAEGMARCSRERSEFLALIGLAFVEAVSSYDAGLLPLEAWLCLFLRNAIHAERKRMSAKVRRWRQLEDRPAPADGMRDFRLDLSEDALTVAYNLIPHPNPRKAVKETALAMYCKMSWRRYWAAIDELQNYVEDLP